jgi:hypothetical protein
MLTSSLFVHTACQQVMEAANRQVFYGLLCYHSHRTIFQLQSRQDGKYIRQTVLFKEAKSVERIEM